MSISVLGLPSSRKTPGVYMAVILGGPGAGGAVGADRLCLMGNMLVAGNVVTAPAQTIPAGTAAIATPVQVLSEADAIDKFGRGSEMHLMCQAAFAQSPNVPLWACPVAEAAGATKGSQVLTITGTAPTSDLTVTMYIDGKKIEVVIPSGTTILNTATAIAQAVLDQPDLPCTAQFAIDGAGPGYKVTFTAKQGGTRGMRITVKLDVMVGTRVSKIRTGALAATVAGMTFTHGAEALSATGAGTETTTFATALANMGAERWHRVAIAMEDSTNIVAAGTSATNKAAATSMLWEQVVAGNTYDGGAATVGAVAVSALVNNPRVQLVNQKNSVRSAGVLAAAVACARLMGDSYIGGTCVGEIEDCAANLDGTMLAAVPDQELSADRPVPSSIELALNYGVTVLVGSPARPGYTQIVRSVTTRHKDATTALNYSVLDTSEVTVTDYVAGLIRSTIQSRYARAKMGTDALDGTPPKVSGVVTASMLKSLIASILADEEAKGHIINVSVHATKLTVERDAVVRGRANAEIPVEPAPAFHTFGGNVRQQAA